MSLFATRLSVERPLEGFRASAQPSSGGRSKAVGRTLAIRKEGDFGTPTPRLWYANNETLVRKQRDFDTQTTRLWYANTETLADIHWHKKKKMAFLLCSTRFFLTSVEKFNKKVQA